MGDDVIKLAQITGIFEDIALQQPRVGQGRTIQQRLYGTGGV